MIIECKYSFTRLFVIFYDLYTHFIAFFLSIFSAKHRKKRIHFHMSLPTVYIYMSCLSYTLCQSYNFGNIFAQVITSTHNTGQSSTSANKCCSSYNFDTQHRRSLTSTIILCRSYCKCCIQLRRKRCFSRPFEAPQHSRQKNLWIKGLDQEVIHADLEATRFVFCKRIGC